MSRARTAPARVAVAAVLVLLGTLAVAEEAPPVSEPPSLADLAFLVGRWRSVDGEAVWEEQWLHAEGDSMPAVTRWVHGGKTRLVELQTIEARREGLVLSLRHFGAGLEPWASEKDGALTWRLSSLDGRLVVFAEAARAFPRVVRYDAREADHLTVCLIGEQEGKPVEMTFRFTKAS